MAIIINHPNAKVVHTTLDVQGSVMFTVVVIGTDLALNTGDPLFDVGKVKELASTAAQSLDDQKLVVDMIRLVEMVS